MTRDLTDLWLAERQLAEANRLADLLLQTIIESTPCLIYAKDLQGRMLLANPPALRLIGKDWDEVKGRTDLEFLSNQTQAEAVMADSYQPRQQRNQVYRGRSGGDQGSVCQRDEPVSMRCEVIDTGIGIATEALERLERKAWCHWRASL